MFEAILGETVLELSKKNGHYLHNGNAVEADIQHLDKNEWHVLLHQRSYRIWVHEVDQEKKEIILSVNGKKTRVHIRSHMERLLKELGMDNALEQKVDSIKAPMPGLIQSIKVSQGAEVAKGDPVLILEAMKMENVIKSPGDGIIASIHVTEGASVEKNELLIRFE